jgi:H+/Cl- antiporter ClcA
VFFAIWYFFTCITNGTNTPAGLFLPGMILGCCVGRLMGDACLAAKIIDEKEKDTAY